MKLSILTSLVSLIIETYALRNIYPPRRILYTKSNSEPLFLTPLIESGNLRSARSRSEVHGVYEGIESHAGFFTVNKTTNSNLYFWFFPAEISPETAPVVLWLQGGPGASSLYGLFSENGPFFVRKHDGLKLRKERWSRALNVIYIDNPVGTGFSFTESKEGYAKDEVKVGEDLYSALSQFFLVFSDFAKNDFFVTGESYGGKYVPAIAYTIHNKNKLASQKINLKGIAIGNGLTDPENMMNYGDYFYQIGLIDLKVRQFFLEAEAKIVADIKNKNYLGAFENFDELLNGDITKYKSTFFNYTGFTFYYNYLHDKDYSVYGDSDEFLQKPETRQKIHVGSLKYNSGKEVELYLKNDIMQSVKPWVEVLLENYSVLFYSGQLDIIIPYPNTLSFLNTLKWSGTELYKKAERKIWLVDGDLAGYSKTAGNLTEVLVRNSGHMVPTDQPVWALSLILQFTSNKPF